MSGEAVDFSKHDAMSHPGAHRYAMASCGDDVAGLCEAVQGLLLHDHYGGLLYGIPPDGFLERSRVTQPVTTRLDAVLSLDPSPLSQARNVHDREVGTCRDFALLLTSLLREQGMAARVRCGFASYFTPGQMEDHWVCECWVEEERRWARIDAQLDGAHCSHLSIGFDTTDLPADCFVSGVDAWRRVRSDEDCAVWGKGEIRELWFIEVNLVRDVLWLLRADSSAWDTWRTSPPACQTMTPDRLAAADNLAAWAHRAVRDPALEHPGNDVLEAVQCPPWQSGSDTRTDIAQK